MSAVPRKKSPRAPSVALDDAIEKTAKIYDKERCSAAPIDIVAQHLGYRSSANGAALATIASLKYYGLLERPKEGFLAVSKEFEAYRFAPSESTKKALIKKWLKAPAVFSVLLEKYAEALPSEATLKFDLIQTGFSPLAADVCLQAFVRSTDYANHFEEPQLEPIGHSVDGDVSGEVDHRAQTFAPDPEIRPVLAIAPLPPVARVSESDDVDRIPIRLAGGRKAWIEIPMPFYEADKERLKKQIDLLLTDDEENINDQD